MVLMNLRAKYQSNREIQQRKVVKYGRRTKNHWEEKKLSFLCSTRYSSFWHPSNKEIQQIKIVKCGRKTQKLETSIAAPAS